MSSGLRKPKLPIFYQKKQVDVTDVTCQKCLQKGHWTYQCTGKRKSLTRETHVQILEKRIKLAEDFKNKKKNSEIKKPLKSETSSSSSESDSSSSSSDSDSSNSSSSTSSSSSSGSDKKKKKKSIKRHPKKNKKK